MQKVWYFINNFKIEDGKNMKTYNFSPGPAALPESVKKQITKDLLSHKNDQSSILEISHRSNEFQTLVSHVKDSLKQVLKIGDDFEIAFVSGGATMQFALTPLNFAIDKKRIAMVDSGQFSLRASEQAQEIPGVKVDFLDSSKSNHYTRLPFIPFEINPLRYDYFHLTVNNTVEGTCYQPEMIPNLEIPIVADMTSCLGEIDFDLNRFSLVIASTQKNLGIAGVTIVLIRKSWLNNANLQLPTIMQYKTFVDSNSMVNTPPVFPIYVTGKMLDWILENGGIEEMDKRARERANLLYDFLDHSKNFKAPVKESDRSVSNVIFTSGDDQKDLQIAEDAQHSNLISLKGYRGFGGLRASLYNGMPLDGVKALITFLERRI